MLLSSLFAAMDQLDVVLNTLQGHTKGAALYLGHGIGKHIRHTSDHLQALLNAKHSQLIDYNYRTRDSETEKDIAAALAILAKQRGALEGLRALDVQMVVAVASEISFSAAQSHTFQSTLAREILYLINHSIHHVAYIKLTLKHAQIELPDHIGLAPCTLSFQKAQSASASALLSERSSECAALAS